MMNPRIMEYDVAPITASMALIAWRVCARGNTIARAAVLLGAFFLAANALALVSWRAAECCVLVVVFVAGVWNLLQPGSVAEREPALVLEAEHI